eukprot:scaffold20507_cov30-Phaeocystis_antarctica.AAC.1
MITENCRDMPCKVLSMFYVSRLTTTIAAASPSRSSRCSYRRRSRKPSRASASQWSSSSGSTSTREAPPAGGKRSHCLASKTLEAVAALHACGTIDKFEFAALAEEVEQNYKRRTLLTAAAAAVGAVIVAKYNT